MTLWMPQILSENEQDISVLLGCGNTRYSPLSCDPAKASCLSSKIYLPWWSNNIIWIVVTKNYSIQWNFCASAPTFRWLERVPTWFNSWNNDSCFYHSCHNSVLRVITSHTPLSLSPSNSQSNGRSSWTLFGTSHPSCQWVLFCSIGSVDQGLKIDIQNSLERSMDIHTHWLSNALTTSMFALKKNWTKTSRMNNIWSSSKTSGKLGLLCLRSCTCSCGVACLRKEMKWVSKYTKNIPDDRKYSLVQRRDPCLKLILSSTTYGSTCLLEQEQIVRESLPRSLLIYS